MQRNILFFLFFFSIGLSAQNVPESYGSRANGIGNAAVTFSDAFSVFSNQAGLGQIDEITAGVYAENRFLVSDLNSGALAVAIPTKSGTFGIGATYYGFESYNNLRGTIAYGRKLVEDKLFIGAEFDFINFSIPDYSSTAVITFGLGVQYNLTENLTAAAHIFNPIETTTASDDDLLESHIRFGLSYVPSEQVGIYLEAKKSYHYPPDFRGGVEYAILNKLILRVGFATLSSRINEDRFGSDLATVNAGIGLRLKTFNIDIADRYHPVLGHSPSLTLIFNRKAKTIVNEVE